MAGFFGANNETSTMSQLCEWALNFCPGLSVRIAQFTGNKKPALLNAVFMELRGRSGQDVCGEVSRIRTARLRYFRPGVTVYRLGRKRKLRWP